LSETLNQAVATPDRHCDVRDWQKQRSARHDRLTAASRFASGKMVPPENVKALLEAVIRPGDRVCLEGDNQKQADLLDAASSPGDGLLFVRGLARDAIDGLCQRLGAAVAIVNPGDAYLLGGSGAALDAVAEEAKALGAARVVRVAVSVASHTSRLFAASTAFRKVLDQVPTRRAPVPGVRLFSGIDGSAVLDVRSGLDKLAAQISHTVQWAACLEGCVEAGASAILELGPGRALAEMASSTYPDIPARSFDDFRTLQGVRAWLARQ
jgi:[acyl-carrier-protein] S-malonyltransferase